MVTLKQATWKHLHYTPFDNCVKKKNKPHSFVVLKTGWIVCQYCGWRDPADF